MLAFGNRLQGRRDDLLVVVDALFAVLRMCGNSAISAPAAKFGAGAAHDDAAQVWVLRQGREGRAQVFPHRQVNGIQFAGMRQRHRYDGAVVLKQDGRHTMLGERGLAPIGDDQQHDAQHDHRQRP